MERLSKKELMNFYKKIEKDNLNQNENTLEKDYLDGWNFWGEVDNSKIITSTDFLFYKMKKQLKK